MYSFGKEVSDVVVRKIYVCNAGFLLPALKKVGTEFIQEYIVSDSDDDSSCSVIIVIQISVCSFTFTDFFPNSSSIERGHQSLIWHFKNRTRDQPELERKKGSLRIGSSLTDKVTKSYFD